MDKDEVAVSSVHRGRVNQEALQNLHLVRVLDSFQVSTTIVGMDMNICYEIEKS